MTRVTSALLCLVCVSTRSAEVPSRLPLPADVAMNTDAGRGGPLLITLRLKDGEALRLALDTGSSSTSLDKSLEPKLVKDPMVTGDNWVFGERHNAETCLAPTLYLGSVPLKMTGTNVPVYDFKELKIVDPIVGILGMNVLRHYCIQLDFDAGKIRFLDDRQTDKKSWGKAFPLVDIGDGCFAIRANITGGGDAGSLIDTGCNYDGWLESEAFRSWTNASTRPTAASAWYPTALLGGETYAEVLHAHRLDPNLQSGGDPHMQINGIGLHFLARHLVTLDFPNRTMYLKRTRDLPLAPDGFAAALAALNKQRKKTPLPGWLKDEHADFVEGFSYPDPDSVIITVRKDSDPFIFHYTMTRHGKSGTWNLQKVWRTPESGEPVAEYPLPAEPGRK